MQAAQRVCVRVRVGYAPSTIVRMMECRPKKLYKLAAGSHSNKNAELICLLVRVCPAASVVRDAEG